MKWNKGNQFKGVKKMKKKNQCMTLKVKRDQGQKHEKP